MHFPGWLGIVLMLAAFSLMVAFHQVVRGAVQQGDTRRKATAAHVEEQWRCKALNGPRARVDCLLRLNSALPTVGWSALAASSTASIAPS
jgi:hypothetical protein